MKFLIQRAGLRNEAFARPFRIVVFSRFDGPIVNPYDDAVVCDCLNSSDVPALDLYLYNSTGEAVTGFHYDPVTFRESFDDSAVEPTGGASAIQKICEARKRNCVDQMVSIHTTKSLLF